MQGRQVTTAGGRVLGVTAIGDDIQQALAQAYEAVSVISWQGCYYRRDIGHRALARLKDTKSSSPQVGIGHGQRLRPSRDAGCR